MSPTAHEPEPELDREGAGVLSHTAVDDGLSVDPGRRFIGETQPHPNVLLQEDGAERQRPTDVDYATDQRRNCDPIRHRSLFVHVVLPPLSTASAPPRSFVASLESRRARNVSPPAFSRISRIAPKAFSPLTVSESAWQACHRTGRDVTMLWQNAELAGSQRGGAARTFGGNKQVTVGGGVCPAIPRPSPEGRPSLPVRPAPKRAVCTDHVAGLPSHPDLQLFCHTQGTEFKDFMMHGGIG